MKRWMTAALVAQLTLASSAYGQGDFSLGKSVEGLVGPTEAITFAAGAKYSGTYMLSLLVPTREREFVQSDIALNRSGSPSISADYLRVLTRLNAWLDLYAGGGAKVLDSRAEMIESDKEPGDPIVAVRLPLGANFNLRPINSQVALEATPSWAVGQESGYFTEAAIALRLLI